MTDFISARDRAAQRQAQQPASPTPQATPQPQPARPQPAAQAQSAPSQPTEAPQGHFLNSNFPQTPGGEFQRAVISGIARAGDEALDGIGAIARTMFRHQFRGYVIPEDVADDVIRRSPLGQARVFGQRVVDPHSGDIMPDAPELIERPRSMPGRLVEGITQFTAGYATLGRVLGPANNLNRIQLAGRGLAQGAATDFLVWDGNEARLSNLLRDWADLRDPVTAYLAANEDDDELEGRIKATLEGAGLGVLFEGFFAGLRALKVQRAAVGSRANGIAGGRATEADIAAAARQVAEANARDAERVTAAYRRQASAMRRQDIDTAAEASLRRIESEVNGTGLDSRNSAVANQSEMASIQEGKVSPTTLSPRQEEALARAAEQRTAVETQRQAAHRIEDMRDAAEAGDTPGAMRIFEEINAARTAQPEFPGLEELDQLYQMLDEVGGAGETALQKAELDQDAYFQSLPIAERAAYAAERQGKRQGAVSHIENRIAELEREQEAWASRPRRAGPTPLQVTFARGGDKGEVTGNVVTDSMGQHYPLSDFRAVVQSNGNVVLAPVNRLTERVADEGATGLQRPLAGARVQAAENTNNYRSIYHDIPEDTAAGAAAKPRQPQPASNTVDIIPDAPLEPRAMVTVARAQSSRVAASADAAATATEATALRTEAERVSAIADELSDAIANGGNVNEVAAKLMAHLDDEATQALFPKRQAGAVDAMIGQTDGQGFARATGEAAPETPIVDEAFVRAVAERYARSADVASASVMQRARAWNAGEPPVRATDINLEHVATEDQVKAFIHAATDLSEASIRHIRGESPEAVIGVRTDAQQQAIARALAADIGSDPGSLMARAADLTGSTSHLDSKIEALRMLHVTAADESSRLMRAYLASKSEADLSRALVALQSFASVHAALKGSTSEIARALRSLQHTVSPDRSLIEQFQGIVDEGVLRSLDPTGSSRNALDALQKLGGAITHTNRRGVARLFEPKFGRAVEDFYTSSILSGPPTHVLNFLETTFNTIMQPIERMIGGTATAIANGGDISAIREGADQMVGMLASSREAFRFAARAFKENRTFLDSTFEEGYRSNFRAEAFGLNPSGIFGQTINGLGKVIGVVPRVLGFQDEFFKQIAYRSQLYANALREARAAGIHDPAALRSYVNEFVSAGFDGNGHSIRAGVSQNDANLINNAYDRALRTARRNTYSEPLGPVLGTLERGLRAIPLGRLLVPFFRTPVNIVKFAARRTPGLSQTMLADITGRNGRHVQEQAIGQMALGTIIYGTAITYALDGSITGSGPSDPRVRARLMESGWQPYSIKIGNRYVSYNRIGGLGLMLGVVADNVELANETYSEHSDDGVEVGMQVVVNLAQMMRDKTFFQGIANVFGAIENANPEVEADRIEKFLGSYAGAVVPAAVARATDDGFMHRPRNLLDAVQARTWARDKVEYRRNWIGERIGHGQPLTNASFVNPIAVTQTDNDTVLNELARIAVVSRGGVSDVQRRLHDIDLTDFNSPSGRNAFDRYQELMSETKIRNRTLREALTELITSDRYQNRMTDGTVEGELEVSGSRQEAIVRIRRNYMRQAERELRAEMPDLDARMRESEALERQRRRPNATNTERTGEGLPRGLEWLGGQ